VSYELENNGGLATIISALYMPANCSAADLGFDAKA
jgi:hypothetical protein